MKIFEFIISFYLLIELFISSVTMCPLAVLKHFIEKLIRLFYGNKSCRFGIHWWGYSDKFVDAVGLPKNARPHVRLYTRHCEGECNKHYYSFYPEGISVLFKGWKEGILKEPIHLTRVE